MAGNVIITECRSQKTKRIYTNILYERTGVSLMFAYSSERCVAPLENLILRLKGFFSKSCAPRFFCPSCSGFVFAGEYPFGVGLNHPRLLSVFHLLTIIYHLHSLKLCFYTTLTVSGSCYEILN